MPPALARRADWLLPGFSSLLLSVPLCWYVGARPGWLDAAWPVSAVLVGFVIPLLVFLLQAVGGGGLKATRTYRVVIADSAVAWPTFLWLLFIIWVAVIERFAGHRDAPAWVSTWALGFFLAPWVALLAVFDRTSRLLAPARGDTRARARPSPAGGALPERKPMPPPLEDATHAFYAALNDMLGVTSDPCRSFGRTRPTSPT
jgi:hypothetical protein